MKKHFWRTVLFAGLLVGSLDIIAALAHFYIKTKKDPVIVLKYIASAVFGNAAYTEDNMAVYGLAFHFLVAFVWTLFFFLIYPKLKLISFNRVLTGIVYGIFIWLVMTRLVVPMSRAATGAFDLKQAIIGATILIVAIGIPLSFIAKKFYARRQW